MSDCIMCWLVGVVTFYARWFANRQIATNATTRNPAINKNEQRGNAERIGLSTDMESSARTESINAESITSITKNTCS